MKARKRKYVVMAQMQPVGKHCGICHGARGGVRGNNVVIDGKRICDYCHSDMLGESQPKIVHVANVEEAFEYIRNLP